MQWSGEGLIIGVKRHGETSVIVEAMVLGRGRHFGLVRGGRLSKKSPTLQAGNSVKLDWRARLEEHLGIFTVEILQSRAARLIADRQSLYINSLLGDHLRLLAERDANDGLLAMAISLLDSEKDKKIIAIKLARFELSLLEELGFGIDVFSCAMSGQITGLTHISPNTGRAVTFKYAKPYIDRLLPLPAFFLPSFSDTENKVSEKDISDAFKLTGFFLSKHVWSTRAIEVPITRDRLIKILL
jgi:DNA repair protein RecO (recombination protein O)